MSSKFCVLDGNKLIIARVFHCPVEETFNFAQSFIFLAEFYKSAIKPELLYPVLNTLNQNCRDMNTNQMCVVFSGKLY